ncbi:MAG: hypothetical protein QOF12_2309 [Solirubrobacteraceae bacterium]|jgi:hypothetical protein|nr:hypothetical protein [Solirubrobacteraceae bacterium]
MTEPTGTTAGPPLTMPIVAPPAATAPGPTGTDAGPPLTVPIVLGGGPR